MNIDLSSSYLNVIAQVSLFDMNIQQLFESYHKAYLNSEKAQLFVASSRRIPDELREHPYIGLANRQVGLTLPKERSLQGGGTRGAYKQAGLFKPKGDEFFRGCVVFPVFNENKKIIAATGYRFGRVRSWQQAVIHWQRPEAEDYFHYGIQQAKEVMHEQTYH